MEIAGKRSKARRGGRKPNPKSMIQGEVKPRKCRHCGHHEIGIVTKSGEFLALKTGPEDWDENHGFPGRRRG